MQAKRKLTFLVMPSCPHKRVFSLSVPFSTVAVIFLTFGMILFIASAGAWRMYRFHQVEQKSYRLEMENRLAKTQIKDQGSRIEYLTQEIFRIRERTGYIQNYLGLKPQGAGSGKIGQGGVELTPQGVLKSSKFVSSELHQHVSIPTTNVDSLSPQDIGQLDADLKQVVGALQERQEKLDHTPSISPVDPRESWISSSYGVRISPFTGKEKFHPGVDIAGGERTSIMAPAKGIVVFMGRDGSLGMTVRIRHDSVHESTYGHLNKASVKKGQHVERGDVIGYMGNSGRSTGPHLHYEVEKNGKSVNPLPYMMDWRDGHLVMAAE
jgi:murein DD-endopeptidase MepM/ murein hydrolase activator NlpD